MAIDGSETDCFSERAAMGSFDDANPIVNFGEFYESHAHDRNQSNIVSPGSCRFVFEYGNFGFAEITGGWTLPVRYGTSLSITGATMFWDTVGDQVDAPFPELLPDGTLLDAAFDPRLPSNNPVAHDAGFYFLYGPPALNLFTPNSVPAPLPVPPLIPGIWQFEIFEQLICITANALGLPMPKIILRDASNLANKITLNLGNLYTGAGFLDTPPPGTSGTSGIFQHAPSPELFNGARVIIDTRIALGNNAAFYPQVTLTNPGRWPVTHDIGNGQPWDFWKFDLIATKLR